MKLSPWIVRMPGSLSVIWSICIVKMSWFIFMPKGMWRNWYLPLWVLKVVRKENSSSRCVLQNPSFASNFEKVCLASWRSHWGWGFVVLLDDSFIQDMRVKVDMEDALWFVAIGQGWNPLSHLGHWHDDLKVDHLLECLFSLFSVVYGDLWHVELVVCLSLYRLCMCLAFCQLH